MAVIPLHRLAPLVLLSLGLFPARSAGQDVRARAFLSPGPSVEVGRPFVLNVEVTGAQSLDADPVVPDLSSFARFLGNSTQSSVRMVNGTTSVALTVQYRFQALTEGRWSIPSVEVAAGGQSLSTETLELSVAPTGSGSGAPRDDGLTDDDLFITADASATSVLVGEPFIVEYRIWTRVDVSNFGMTSVPEPDGFWVEDLTAAGQPNVEQLTRDGVAYASAVIRRVALVPTTAGERTIDPIGLEAQVRVRGGRDPFDGFFGRNSPFGSVAAPLTVASNPLTIDVRPLPEGRPEPFSGVVGNLSATAALDRDSLASNDAVTLTVRVEGQGNLRSVTAPVLDLPADFEVFPPEIEESVSGTANGLGGSKTFEYVLVPRAPGAREIPAIEFAFFDDDEGTYRTTSTEPLSLTVSGTAIEGPGLARGGVAQLREDIRFIRLGPLELRRSGGNLFAGPGFWLLALLPLALVGGAAALRRHRDLVEGDVAYARGRSAGRTARKRLARARRLASEEDARPFYAEVARALRGLAADRLNLAEAGIRTTELDAELERAGVGAPLRSELQECLDRCDRQRFAPPGSDSEERSRFLERVGDLMTRLDRAVR